MNFLIETKQEYTIHLVNSIYPLIYDGLQNIYEEAKKTAKNKKCNLDEYVEFSGAEKH